jgi:hypothetical protein
MKVRVCDGDGDCDEFGLFVDDDEGLWCWFGELKMKK